MGNDTIFCIYEKILQKPNQILLQMRKKTKSGEFKTTKSGGYHAMPQSIYQIIYYYWPKEELQSNYFKQGLFLFGVQILITN